MVGMELACCHTPGRQQVILAPRRAFPTVVVCICICSPNVRTSTGTSSTSILMVSWSPCVPQLSHTLVCCWLLLQFRSFSLNMVYPSSTRRVILGILISFCKACDPQGCAIQCTPGDKKRFRFFPFITSVPPSFTFKTKFQQVSLGGAIS